VDVQNGVAAVDDIIRFWCQLAGGDVGNLKCHLKSHKPISFASSRGWEVTVGPEQPQTMLGIHICHSSRDSEATRIGHVATWI